MYCSGLHIADVVRLARRIDVGGDMELLLLVGLRRLDLELLHDARPDQAQQRIAAQTASSARPTDGSSQVRPDVTKKRIAQITEIPSRGRRWPQHRIVVGVRHAGASAARPG